MTKQLRRCSLLSGLAALLFFLPAATESSPEDEQAALERKGFVQTVGLGNLSFIFQRNDICYAGSVSRSSKGLFLLIKLKDGTLLYGFQTADDSIEPKSTYQVRVGFHRDRKTYVPGAVYKLQSVGTRKGVKLVAGVADRFVLEHLKHDMMIHFNDQDVINEHFRIEDVDLALDALERCRSEGAATV